MQAFTRAGIKSSYWLYIKSSAWGCRAWGAVRQRRDPEAETGLLHADLPWSSWDSSAWPATTKRKLGINPFIRNFLLSFFGLTECRVNLPGAEGLRWDTYFLRFYPRPAESNSGRAEFVFNNPSRCFWCPLKLENCSKEMLKEPYEGAVSQKWYLLHLRPCFAKVQRLIISIEVIFCFFLCGFFPTALPWNYENISVKQMVTSWNKSSCNYYSNSRSTVSIIGWDVSSFERSLPPF